MSKQVDIDRLFSGRHFDREVIVLRVRWYAVSHGAVRMKADQFLRADTTLRSSKYLETISKRPRGGC